MKARPLRLFSIARALVCCWCMTLALASVAPLDAQTSSVDGAPPVLSTGDDFGAIVDANGNLFVWGTIATEVAPGGVQQIEPSESWADVSVSRTTGASAHILAIRTDGTLWAWGANSRGQVGDGTTVDRAEPFRVSSSTDWVEIAAGEFHSIARRSDGSIYLWGDNRYGQLGFGPVFNDPDLDLETSLGGSMDANSYIAIAAGKLHSHAVRDDGTLWGWGQNGDAEGNSNGNELGFQVGGYPPVGPVSPTQLDRTGWTDLFSGYDSVFALRDTASETGQLWTWGAGALGQGQYPGSSSWTPVRVGSGSNWISVSPSKNSGITHAIGLKSNGALYGWGVNYDEGQLGLPLTDDGKRLEENYSKSSPFRLMSDDSFLAVGAGEGFSVVIRDDGLMLTAGINDVGQLANSQTSSSSVGQDFFYNSSLGLADLQGEGVTISSPLPWTGPTVSASFTMKNGGTGTIEDDFYLSAVLSPSSNYDHVDAVQLEFAPGETELLVTDSLIAGQSLAVPFAFILPDSITQGSYYLVVRADSTELVVETNEDNNDAATVDSYEFFPDLIVSSLAASGGAVLPGDDLTVDVDIDNQGEGTIPAGSTFDLRLFLSPDKTADNSAAVDLDADPESDLETVYEVVLENDLDPGDSLTLDTFTLEVPRMGGGFYFVGVFVDVSEEVTEQTEIVVNNIVVREDGEDNNLSFTDTAAVEITGIGIPDAIDQPDLVFTTSEDGDWFGQNTVFNGDPTLVGNDDAVQSPSLSVGDSAAFSTDLILPAETSTPKAITFDWKAETSSIDNKLIYRVVNGATGGLFNEISGMTEWTTVQRVVPANARAEWVYEKGTDANSDAVYVDNLQMTEITAPDLVIDDIYLPDDATGSYVLLKDKLDLTVNSRNQGTDTALDADYYISIYLSKDRTLDRPDGNPATADDIFLRQDLIPGGIASGGPSVKGFSILLDAAIEDGEYYVIGYIDDYTDGSGNTLPGAANPGGYIGEFVDAGINFDGEGNNVFISSATIEIVALPDLIVSELNADPDYYVIEDYDTGEANSMAFDFTIANIGLTSVNSNVATSILFSQDEVMDPETDYLLLDYSYNGNFGSRDDAPANERLINPGEIDFRQDLIDAGYIGRRLFVGVHIDSDEEVAELDEEHNSAYLLNNDFILSELPILDGLDIEFELDINDEPINPHNITVLNDEVAPYDSDKQPWVGQTTETLDSFDAVTNVLIGDDEVSEFSINIEPATGVRASFWWKVSSQYDAESGAVDYLSFKVNGAEVISPIFGTDDDDWRRVEFALEPGVHVLTWSYVKDGDGSAGQDRGWVDNFVIEELPNLIVAGVTVDDLPVYSGGDTIDTWNVTIQNTGAALAAGTPFDVLVRLLPQDSWADSGAIDLITISDPNTAGLAAGAIRSYDMDTDFGDGPIGALTLPVSGYAQEFYSVGAYVDWLLADLDNGQVVEIIETDNDYVTSSDEDSPYVGSIVQIGLPDLIGRPNVDGGGVTGIDSAPYDNDDPVELTLHLNNEGDGVLEAGSEFDVLVYAASSSDTTLFGESSTYGLGSVRVTIASDVAAGDALPDIDFNTTLPYGIPLGSYYVGVEIDSTLEVKEQGPLPEDGSIREDGEANNRFTTAGDTFMVEGSLSVEEGMDLAIDLGSFEYDGDARWFGRDDDGDPLNPDDNLTFTGGDGAQSPELSVGETAIFSLPIVNSSIVQFDWAADTFNDANVLTVYVNGSPVIDSNGDVLALSGQRDLETVESFIVPDGGSVTWSYSKGAAADSDVVYLDNLTVLPNALPDLAITDVSYGAFEYVLDREGTFNPVDEEGNPQYQFTKFLDIAVTAQNQGADLNASTGAFTSADIDVRLSVNNVYGDEDDIILGSFAQVEGDFDSRNLLSFFGPITLDDHIPEGFYHLIVRFDSNDRVEEFTDSNNLFVSPSADIQITHLPDLIINNPDDRDEDILVEQVLRFSDLIDVDETDRYNPGSSVRMRFDIQNIGLGDVTGAESFTTQVNLRALPRPFEGPADELLPQPANLSSIYGNATTPLVLQEFDITDELNGRSYNPDTGVFDGELKPIDIELFLPSNHYLSTLIDPDRTIEDYLWFFEVIVNRDFPFEETDAFNTWWCVDAHTLITNPNDVDWIDEFNGDLDDGLFGIEFPTSDIDATDWEALYDNVYSVANPEYLLAYAFNRNPASGDTAGNRFPGSYGIIRVEGETDAEDEDFLSVTFDFVTTSTDLTYLVEAADDLSFVGADELLIIDTTGGSYTDLVGPKSLNGEGGLIEVDEVLSVHDQGYSARVTVRDIIATTDADRRFIRIVVSGTEASPVSAETQVANFVRSQMMVNYGVTDPNDALPYGNLDGDAFNNLVELMYGTDPNDIGDVPAIAPVEAGVAEDMALAILAFGGSLTVPTPNIGSGDDYDSDSVTNGLELYLFFTDPADPTD